jgi:hypothetical protein
MFIGKATLTHPENGAPVATFHEECESAHQVIVTFSIRPPISLGTGESLEVFARGNATPVTSLPFPGAGHKTVTGFSGRSAVGCLPAGTEISLVHNPGGQAGAQSVVLGKGVIKEEPPT